MNFKKNGVISLPDTTSYVKKKYIIVPFYSLMMHCMFHLYSREKRYGDGSLKGPRRRSLLARLKGGRRSPNSAPLNHRKNMTVPRSSASRLNRDNSFHVQVTTSTDAKPQSFPWTKMAPSGSMDDRLSTISSRDELEDTKGRDIVFETNDLATQTDKEMLKSILRMPYLRRRNGKKMERSLALDEEFMNVKVNPSDVFAGNRRFSSPLMRNGSKKKDVYGVSNNSHTAQERTKLLYPGYTDSPISTSDEVENEEDFESFDSISDLLNMHNIAPICSHDEGMTNYLNPLGNKTMTPDSENDLKIHLQNQLENPDIGTKCNVLVETKADGVVTSAIKDPLLHNYNEPSSNVKHYNRPKSANYHKSMSNHSLTFVPGSDNNLKLNQNGAGPKRRASSPATPYVSCNSVFSSEFNPKRSSAFSQQTSLSSKDDSSVASLGCSKSTDDVAQRCAQAIDKEESSMLHFQSFMRQRGVNIDMAYIESSDV